MKFNQLCAALLAAIALGGNATAAPATYHVTMLQDYRFGGTPPYATQSERNEWGRKEWNSFGQGLVYTNHYDYLGNFHVNDLNDKGTIRELGWQFPLGAPGSTSSIAVAINDLGQVIGESSRQGVHVPWIYQNGITTNLIDGVTDKRFRNADVALSAINDKGQIVGGSLIDPWNQHALLWDSGQTYFLEDLVDAGSKTWLLYGAMGINDDGDIFGLGILNGRPAWYLAEALPSAPAPIPEPGTYLLMLAGLGALCVARRQS